MESRTRLGSSESLCKVHQFVHQQGLIEWIFFIAEVAEATVQNPDPFGELCEQFKNQAFFSPSSSVNSSLFTKVSPQFWFMALRFFSVSLCEKFPISGNANFWLVFVAEWFIDHHVWPPTENYCPSLVPFDVFVESNGNSFLKNPIRLILTLKIFFTELLSNKKLFLFEMTHLWHFTRSVFLCDAYFHRRLIFKIWLILKT